MRHLIYLAGFILTCFVAQAQNPFMNDGNGRPLYMRSNYVSEGTPYFYDSYKVADVTTVGGQVYSKVKVKVDLVNRIVQFLGDKDEEMVSTTEVRKIHFLNYVEGEGMDVVLMGGRRGLNTVGDSLFQVVDSGKLTIIKHIFVDFKDDKKYGDATTTRTFRKSEAYYVLYPGGVKEKFTRSKDNLLSLMNDKRQLMEDFIKKGELKPRSDEDLQRILRFYNAQQ